MLEQLVRDLLYSARGLVRERTFALTTVATLTVALTLATVVFAVFNAYVLRPYAVRDPYSLSFNGQDQWMTVGNPPLLNAGGLISIAAWVRLGSASGFRNVVAHGFRTNPNQELVLRANSGNYEFNYWNNTDHIAVVAVPEGDIGTWTHLCAVFDGATYALYRNGALAASTPDTTAPPPNMETPWTIGGRTPQTDGGEQRPFQGEIDDVRLYGRALTASEVAALYQR